MKTIPFYIIFIVLTTHGACQVKTHIPMINTSSKELNNKLLDKSYSLLFLSSNDNQVDTLWGEYKKHAFIELVNDTTADDNVRFLAAEILFHKSDSFPPKNLYGALGNVYANALKITGLSNSKFVLAANGWGFLYDRDDVGFIGKRFILIGEPAVKYLTNQLENADQVMYEGSEEATIGNSYHYRIKDIAAFYISKIKNIPVKFYQNIEDRDKEIACLRELLK